MSSLFIFARRSASLLTVFLTLTLSVFSAQADDAPAEAEAEHANAEALPPMKIIRGLAPVSLQNTGLLDYLAPYLTQDTGLAVVWTTAGDSLTLERARTCGGDVLLTENAAPAAQLVKDGHAQSGREIMRDSFVLVGPSYDPARVLGLDIVDALKAIADKHAPFASRGDASGSHQRERALWKKAEREVRDGKNGYVEVGQDMMTALDVAAAAQAYVLADRATFLTWAAGHIAPLTVLAVDKPLLERNWTVMPLNTVDCPKSSAANAKTPETDALAPITSEDVQAFTKWWAAPSAQKHIADFTREGHKVFAPALPTEEDKPRSVKR